MSNKRKADFSVIEIWNDDKRAALGGQRGLKLPKVGLIIPQLQHAIPILQERGVFVLPTVLGTEKDYQIASAAVPALEHFDVRVSSDCLLRVPKEPLYAATLTAVVEKEVDKCPHNKHGVVLGMMSDAEWNKWLELNHGQSRKVMITADNIVIIVEFASQAHDVCAETLASQLSGQFSAGAITCRGSGCRAIGPPLNKCMSADKSYGPGLLFRLPAHRWSACSSVSW
eukprot:TRINITY_DN3673_c0_g4_i2.p1 TRINITY_DN3673_c0_g4~~TRINITY_DN3673_c0_g4_i2.p1  ORF type:complete len:227 (+),score=24.54 TRINITY_DN3673_c0_g4_i2:125-805(+)